MQELKKKLQLGNKMKMKQKHVADRSQEITQDDLSDPIVRKLADFRTT